MKATLAIFRQNFFGYFRNPTGIVFVALFVVVGAVVQFCVGDFFPRNLANLDPLNEKMPYLLLFFIPAITMGVWADERRQGTDELLLTLPATDLDVVLGKFLACVGIYLVALALSTSHVVVLRFLGHPDKGLMLANFLGYAFLGTAFIAVGMVGSILTDSATVAFIFGAAGIAVLLFAPLVDVRAPFQDFADGVVSLRSAGYFVLLALAMLYLNLLLLGKRRWSGGIPARWAHAGIQGLCACSIAASFVAARVPPLRVDLTAERLHSLSAETEKILSSLPADRPVYIQAFVSPKVPTAYVQTREGLLALLREFTARGHGLVQAQVNETEAHSQTARDAEERFGIRSAGVPSEEEGTMKEEQVFLGVAFTSGAEEVVVPFLWRGLSVEYELTRSIQVVTRAKRHKVGVLRTDAKLLGGFDFSSFSQTPTWQVVEELKKQYDVAEVSPDNDYPDDLAALLVAMPSTLTQPQLDRLAAYVTKGRPTLLFDDPAPYFSNMGLAPSEPKGGPRNAFQQQQRPPEPKGKAEEFYEKIGVRWPVHEIVWSSFNPHPEFHDIPHEYVFVKAGNGAREPFNGSEAITSGLEEMLLVFTGRLENAGKGGVRFTPLLMVGEPSGTLEYEQIVQHSFFGLGIVPDRPYAPTKGEKILAARIEGSLPAEGGAKEGGSVNAVVVADLDLISDGIFAFRQQGMKGISFDNVTFVLNAMDVLAGDETFLALRKRRPRYHTLETVEAETRRYKEQQVEEANRAEQEAKGDLASAQERLNRKVQEVEERKDLDEQTKEMMKQNLEEVENRRLEVEKKNIDERKQREIKKSGDETDRKVRAIENDIRMEAVLIFPIPAAVLALVILAIRAGIAAMSKVQEEGR